MTKPRCVVPPKSSLKRKRIIDTKISTVEEKIDFFRLQRSCSIWLISFTKFFKLFSPWPKNLSTIDKWIIVLYINLRATSAQYPLEGIKKPSQGVRFIQFSISLVSYIVLKNLLNLLQSEFSFLQIFFAFCSSTKSSMSPLIQEIYTNINIDHFSDFVFAFQ